ncbi:MAG: hypothetical protein ACPGQV_19810 [Alphaproteobacteria bacterium]
MTRELYTVAIFFPAVTAGYPWQASISFALLAAVALAFLLCQEQNL